MQNDSLRERLLFPLKNIFVVLTIKYIRSLGQLYFTANILMKINKHQ